MEILRLEHSETVVLSDTCSSMNFASAHHKHWEFARIHPQGLDAEVALEQVADDPEISYYHRAFIHVECKQQPEGQRTIRTPRSDLPRLSRQDPVKEKTAIGWRLRKSLPRTHADAFSGEEHGIDLLLIRPRTSSKNVAQVHERIQFHPGSGALMLFCLHQDTPVVYKFHNEAEPVLLMQGQGYVLYQKRNPFKIGKLHYDLVFSDFGPQQYSDFQSRRNEWLYDSDKGDHILHSQLSRGASL
ncbi:MAG: hypothetical protein Q9173_003188 [Seirophora scorigena]